MRSGGELSARETAAKQETLAVRWAIECYVLSPYYMLVTKEKTL